MNEVAITFDVDWAESGIISETLEIVKEAKIKSTWFITHYSPAVVELMDNKLIEVGLHPNFLQGSTQGQTPVGVMNYLTKICPKARSVRTHAMVYSSSIARMFPLYNLTIDSSICLFGAKQVEPFVIRFPEGKKLIKMPYVWSDDGEMINSPEWKLPSLDEEGLKILCFHPIHIALNTCSWEQYLAFKAEYKQTRDLSTVRKFYQVSKYGARNYLLDVMSLNFPFKKLSRIAGVYGL
jgi:hypothetical protein